MLNNNIHNNGCDLYYSNVKPLSDITKEELAELASSSLKSNQFDSLLNECIKKYNYTNEKLATELCVDPRTVSRWRNGTNIPEFHSALAMCFCFGFGYRNSILFIETAGYSIKPYETYHQLLVLYPYEGLESINEKLRSWNMESLS